MSEAALLTVLMEQRDPVPGTILQLEDTVVLLPCRHPGAGDLPQVLIIPIQVVMPVRVRGIMLMVNGELLLRVEVINGYRQVMLLMGMEQLQVTEPPMEMQG